MNEPAQTTTAPFTLEKLRGYCVVEFASAFSELNWQELQDATSGLIEEIKNHNCSSLLIDLSNVERINSGEIAILVRIWKSLDAETRRLAVVSNQEAVVRVLNVSGLYKLWSIVDSREEAAYELGFSQRAELEKRELRLLAWAALPFAMLAVISIIPVFRDTTYEFQTNSQLAALLLSTIALTAGVISVFKDTGIRRILSVVAIVLSLGVLSTLVFDQNPISFRGPAPPQPVRQFE